MLVERVQEMANKAMADAENYYAAGDFDKAAQALRVLKSASDAYVELTKLAAIIHLTNKEVT